MSITVGDLLKLPSLRQAKVLGGRGGLSKYVSSISVLESTDVEVLNDNIFKNSEYFGSEIVITGFLNCQQDVDCQLANIRRMAEGGEVGLILFYVGTYLPSVDQRLIDFADQNDFVLLCMPEKRVDLRYGEVISEVMEAITRDRMRNPIVVSELLERVVRLPKHQRTVETAVRMISDRIYASVVLMDANHHVLNSACWPQTSQPQILRALEGTPLPAEGTATPWDALANGILYRFNLEVGTRQKMILLFITEDAPLEPETLRNAVEMIRLTVNLWSEHHDEVAIHELIKAILQDEPMKMRRLAEIFHIEIASFHEMWLLHGMPERELKQTAQAASDIMEKYCHSVFANGYENYLLVFTTDVHSLHDAQAAAEELLQHAQSICTDTVLLRCSGLQNTAEVRSVYLRSKSALSDLQRIYPGRNFFDFAELAFAEECHTVIAGGEASVAACEKELLKLRAAGETDALAETLICYYLDADSNVTQTAQLLFVHKNTVKYRLKRAGDLLGYRIDKQPESRRLYTAAAVQRLIG